MPKNLINDLVAASPNRRSFLKTLGVATAGVTAMSMAGVSSAKAATATEVEVLQFALNLEYLEAEFYSYTVSGMGIETFGLGTSGSANGSNPTAGGTTTGGKIVSFPVTLSYDVAAQIANDERQHVVLLRQALGADTIAKPNLNLNALGLMTGNINDFARQARIFEDIGVSAYAGAAGLLSTPAVITTAARILSAESQHVAAVRYQIAFYNVSTSALDGADILPPPTGKSNQTLSLVEGNGLCATRTPGEVLYLAFNGPNLTSGAFFPTGVNGAITTSGSAPATRSNLL
jgi:hypothetical protein